MKFSQILFALLVALSLSIHAQEVQDTDAQLKEAWTQFMTESIKSLDSGRVMLEKGMTQAGEFAAVQIPLILKELIVWKRVTVTLQFFILMFFSAVCFYIVYRLINFAKSSDCDSDYEGPTMLISFIFICAGLTLISVAMSHLSEWLLPWIAPRVYLLEYVSHMVGNLN